MADTVDKVAERLANLEVTAAKGFHETNRRFDSLTADINTRFREAEERDIALSRKIDVTAESLRGDIRTVLDAVTSLGDEMRRTTDAIRSEHAADRAMLTTAIEGHARRLHAFEQQR